MKLTLQKSELFAELPYTCIVLRPSFSLFIGIFANLLRKACLLKRHDGCDYLNGLTCYFPRTT